MRRRHRGELLHGVKHLGRHTLYAADAPAVHRLKADRRDLGGLPQAAGVGIGQLGETLPDGLGLVRHVQRMLPAVGADLDEAGALGRTDPFDPAARKLAFVGHVEQPILEARRADIGHEDFHEFLLPSLCAAAGFPGFGVQGLGFRV